MSLFLMTGISHSADDPYAKLRVNSHEIPLLTQEIIKLHLRMHGIQFFDAQQREAEARASARNKAGTENCDADGEYGFVYAVPSWGLTTIFYAANKESDSLTKMVYGAFDKTNETNENRRIANRTQLTLQSDGSIECYTRMAGHPYMWAKEYSKKQY